SVVHGLLIKLGLSPLVAGHALSIAALIAMLCGAYALLRCLRVPAAFAGPGAILLLANPPVQGALITIRGDLLACAFNLCGLALAASDERTRRRWLAPILLSPALRELPALYLISTACVTVVLFGSPGVDENHFLDLDVAIVLFLVAEAAKGRLKGAFAPAALALAALGFCGSLALTRVVPQRQVVSQLLEEVGPSGRPLLSENPWLA